MSAVGIGNQGLNPGFVTLFLIFKKIRKKSKNCAKRGRAKNQTQDQSENATAPLLYLLTRVANNILIK
jgi:hypothetical protein